MPPAYKKKNKKYFVTAIISASVALVTTIISTVVPLAVQKKDLKGKLGEKYSYIVDRRTGKPDVSYIVAVLIVIILIIIIVWKIIK